MIFAESFTFSLSAFEVGIYPVLGVFLLFLAFFWGTVFGGKYVEEQWQKELKRRGLRGSRESVWQVIDEDSVAFEDSVREVQDAIKKGARRTNGRVV